MPPALITVLTMTRNFVVPGSIPGRHDERDGVQTAHIPLYLSDVRLV
jgi:hypothetical protein